MSTDIRQARRWCRHCRRTTLHQATIPLSDNGCGVQAGHIILTIITLGLWLPIWVFLVGLSIFANAVAGITAKYRCQSCGR